MVVDWKWFGERGLSSASLPVAHFGVGGGWWWGRKQEASEKSTRRKNEYNPRCCLGARVPLFTAEWNRPWWMPILSHRPGEGYGDAPTETSGSRGGF